MASKTETKTTKIKKKYTASGLAISDLSLGMQAGSDRGCYAQWKFAKANQDKTKASKNQASGFEVDWEYWDGQRFAQTAAQKKAGKPGDAKWMPGSSSTIDVYAAGVGSGLFRALYTAPSSALKVRCRVLPVSKTRDVTVSVTKTYKDGKLTKTQNNKESKPFFTAKWSAYVAHDFRNDAIPAPDVEVELAENGLTCSVTVSSDDADATYADVEICTYSKGSYTRVMGKDSQRINGEGTWSFTLSAGGTYYARARLTSTTKSSKATSAWAYASVVTRPAVPQNPAAEATGPTSARVAWSASTGATSYKVQHIAGDSPDFDSNPEAVDETEISAGTSYTPSDLEPGTVHWFRVRACNASGESGWSATCSCTVATPPEAPTVLDTASSYMEGGTARIRWTHNATDGSAQTAAQVELSYTGPNAPGEGETVDVDGAVQALALDLAGMGDGTSVAFRVRTKGAHADWSPWSGTRSFAVYEQPNLGCVLEQPDGAGDWRPLSSDDPLACFPIHATLDASGGGNAVVAYDVAIVCAAPADVIDMYGRTVRTSVGEVAWQGHYDTSDDPLEVEVGAGECMLADGGTYELRAAVAMASGLRAESDPAPFGVSFDVSMAQPSATVTFDPDYLTADVVPACYELDPETGEETGELRDGTSLAVYRIEADGDLVCLARRVANDGATTVTDPHATFRECWYHVVAVDDATGVSTAADYSDDSEHGSCTIQWGESWRPAGEGATRYDYEGSILDGFYNMTFDQDVEPSAEAARYAGRKRPVHYYDGIAVEESASYTIQFSLSDAETMSLARALLAYPGDVYVREPTGTGYWARVRGHVSYAAGIPFATLSVTAKPSDRYDAALEDEGEEE